MLTQTSTSRPKLPSLLSRKEQETFSLGQCTLALQRLHFEKVSCCLSGNSCREAPGSSPALPQGLRLNASQVLMVTQLWAKPLLWWALGKQTMCYHHLLLPHFSLSVGHAGIPLSIRGAGQCWQEVLPTGRQKPSAVSTCPFSEDLWKARRDSG